MTKKSGTVAIVLMAVVLTIQGRAQNLQPAKVRVEIVTTKKIYVQGEPIRFRVSIENNGASAFYVAKSFAEAGGGIAGFYVTVKQLSGKHAKEGCGGVGDRGIFADSRTPEQILKEDYLRLGPNEFVGFEGRYWGCVAKYPGKYEITAQYSAQDLNQAKVKDLKIDGAAVLPGTYESGSATFAIH